MGDVQVAYGDCLQRSKCDVTNKEGYEKSLNKRYDSFDKMKMHQLILKNWKNFILLKL